MYVCACTFNYRIILSLLIKVHKCLEQVFRKKIYSLPTPPHSRLCPQTSLKTDWGPELEPNLLGSGRVASLMGLLSPIVCAGSH